MTELLGIDLTPEPAPTADKPTSQMMLAMLRRHYLPDETRPAGVFAPEIQAPGPVQRRADLIWLGCVAASGNHLVGHEVKVSRADVLSELADLTKSDPWQRYCDAWYLVVPHLSLIKGLDLPESWGVMLPPSGRRTRSMTIHRPAPALHPMEQGPALKTLAAWQHWKLRDARARIEALDKQCERLDHANNQLRLETMTQHPSSERDVVAKIVRELGGVWAGEEIGNWMSRVNVEDVVAALKDLGALHGRRDEAQRALDSARTGLGTYQRAIGMALEKINREGKS
jgi:hypothetical protein